MSTAQRTESFLMGAFFYPRIPPNYSNPRGRVFSLRSKTQQLQAGTLSASTHTFEEVFTSENEVRNKPLWFTSRQEYELKHTIRNGTETSSLAKDSHLAALLS